jgi:hypothetical protein
MFCSSKVIIPFYTCQNGSSLKYCQNYFITENLFRGIRFKAPVQLRDTSSVQFIHYLIMGACLAKPLPNIFIIVHGPVYDITVWREWRKSCQSTDQIQLAFPLPQTRKICKMKGKLRHESVWGSECIDPHFLDLSTSWRWVVSFKPWGTSPWYPLDRR